MFLDVEHLSPVETLALFERARLVHLAAEGEEGPVLRAVHPVVVDGVLHFHGSPRGEKMEVLGRPAVIVTEEVLATLPSTWQHAERACPATTYFRSAHARGTLEAVDDPVAKARVLQAMMVVYQPEGGYRPITHDDPMYAAAVRNIAVVRLANATLVGRRKVGQNKSPEVRRAIMRQLWKRGAPGDLAALDAMVDATPEQCPAFLSHGTARFVTQPRAHVDAVVALLSGAYWQRGASSDRIGRMHLGSAAWVVAVDGGEVVASARAVSDTAKYAYVMDVIVRADRRGQGLGRALTACLLDHPAVRDCARVELHTRDAQGVYAALGFGPMVDPEWRVGMRLARGQLEHDSAGVAGLADTLVDLASHTRSEGHVEPAEQAVVGDAVAEGEEHRLDVL